MSMKSWYKTEYQVYIYNFCSINLLCHDFWYIRICSCMFVWIWHHPGLFPYLIQLCSQLCAATANILHSICYWPNNNWASLVAQTVKNLPAMQETQVQSLGQEDALEKRMANHCSILAWRIPWTEEPTEAGYSNVVAKSQTRLSNCHIYNNNLCDIVLDTCFLNTGRKEGNVNSYFSLHNYLYLCSLFFHMGSN